MEKKKNMYYGISLDGLTLKIAEIEQFQGQIILHRIQSHKLVSPLNTDYTDVTNLSNRTRNEGVSVKEDTYEFDMEKDFDDIDIMSDNYAKDVKDFDATSDQNSSTDDEKKSDSRKRSSNDIARRNDAVHQFLGNFPLDSGMISFSCLDGKVVWKPFRMNKKASVMELRKRVLSDYQLRDPNCHVDFIAHSDFDYTALIHQGEFELMNLLNKTAQTSFNLKKPFRYQYIEPIEISLLNIYNIFYTNEIGRYTTLLYIGDEIKMGVVIKNREIVRTFPIMVSGKDPEKVREAVLAKLLLEQENSDTPVIENIVLSGVYATRDDIEFYNKKTGNSHKLFELDPFELNKYKADFRVSGAVPPNDVPAYIIPVSLALHGAMYKNKELNKFNLLPRKISDSYNVFNLKWYGIALIILVIIAFIVGNNSLNKKKTRLVELDARLKFAAIELRDKESFNRQVDTLEDRIQEIYSANQQTADIANKNVWNIVFASLSEFSNRNPMIWIESVNLQDNKILLKGKSHTRERISSLSQVFDSGHITRITESEIESHKVWDFDLSFPRPQGAAANEIQVPDYLKSYNNYEKFLRDMQVQHDPSVAKEVLPEPVPTKQEPTPPVVAEAKPVQTTPPAQTSTQPKPPAQTSTQTAPPTQATQPVQTTPPKTTTAPVTPAPVTPVPATPTHTTPAPTTPAPVTPASPKYADGHNDPKELYENARDAYLSNNFAEAVSLLDLYVTRFKSSSEISLAYYLLGEINYVLNNFDSAVASFSEVYKLKKDKVAESLFFTAKSYEGLSDYDNAIKFYTILKNDYANNPLARTAEEQLKILTGEYQ